MATRPSGQAWPTSLCGRFLVDVQAEPRVLQGSLPQALQIPPPDRLRRSRLWAGVKPSPPATVPTWVCRRARTHVWEGD